jgi:hypothetical protein
MYSPTAYFWARTLSGMIIQMISPTLMTLIVFFGLGIPITLDSFLNFYLVSLQLAIVGCAIGYMCGLMFDDDNAARGVVMFFTLIFMLVSGGLNNAANYPPVIEQLQFVSPNRYALEVFFRVMSADQHYPKFLEYQLTEDMVLDILGFTRGNPLCHYVLGGLFGLFMCLGWIVIVCRNRKV